MFRPVSALFTLLLLFICLVTLPVSAEAVSEEKTPTAEQIAETVIAVYGSRPGLTQIRRNGVERGRLIRTNETGRLEETNYERRFIRGEGLAKDRIRVDQKMPSADFALVYGEGRMWGVIGGSTFTPREEAKNNFLSNLWHDIDALLRYKENNSTVTFVNKDKQKNIDLWVLDVEDPEKHRTRYYISSRTYRVLWLEYEQPSNTPDKPEQFKKTFHDYRIAQGTLVPFRTVLYQNGSQIQETRVLTITYGVKMDETLFQNADAKNASIN